MQNELLNDSAATSARGPVEKLGSLYHLDSKESCQSWKTPAWKALPKRWGHSFHPMCSYLAMFPPGIPRYFIEQFTEPGDIVLDPFSGRGTAPLEACVSSRVGIGIDLNPLAYLLTHAKVDPPTEEEALERIGSLRRHYRRIPTDNVPENIKMLFDGRGVLPRLLYLKKSLDREDRTDRFLLAALTGILHGNVHKDGKSTSYLSISMPNTFSMSPNYIRRYIRKHRLHKIPVDVFDQLTRKVKRLFKDGPPSKKGRAYLYDARQFSQIEDPDLRRGNVKLIVTSPPYLKVVNYGKFNWIRLWLLDEPTEKVDKQLRLDDQHTLSRYLEFMATVLQQCEQVIRPDGVCVFAIGDVQEPGKPPNNLAELVWDYVKGRAGLNLLAILEDSLPVNDKVTRIWGSKKGRATKVDRFLILYKERKPFPYYRNGNSALMSKLTS